MRALAAEGCSKDVTRGQVRAGRWQRIGRAVVRHNAELTVREKRRVVLIVWGPRATLTSFTSLDEWGLAGWERDAIHVLVPRDARVVQPPGLPLRIHYTDRWHPGSIVSGRNLHRPGPAAVVAAADLEHPRSACGVLAAVVQQRLVRVTGIAGYVEEQPRIKHRALLLAAAHDIEQGAQALSEIDFARLCRRAGLPEPSRQTVRVEPSGARRYLDVEWLRGNRRHLVVEVDGALHLAVPRWWSDQLRQNELVISGDRVLRFPSVILRCEQDLVIDQLRRGLA